MAAGTNIDWLVHIYYARRDFMSCRVIIERELYRSLNPEYLYFVKVMLVFTYMHMYVRVSACFFT